MKSIEVPSKYKDTTLHNVLFFVNIISPLVVLGWTLVQVYTFIKLNKISNQMDEQAKALKTYQKQIENKI